MLPRTRDFGERARFVVDLQSSLDLLSALRVKILAGIVTGIDCVVLLTGYLPLNRKAAPAPRIATAIAFELSAGCSTANPACFANRAHRNAPPPLMMHFLCSAK